MNRLKPFTVSIFGRSRLLGLVVSDGLNSYPKSTWYDYSFQMKAAVAAESQIAKSGYMRPEGIKSVRIASGNQASPRKTDVTLKFSSDGETDRVLMAAGRKSRLIVFNERTCRLPSPYYDTSKQIVQAIGQMLA